MDNKGFTLVEILISVVILSLIIIFVVTIYSSVIHSSRVEEERLIVMTHNIGVIESLKEIYYSTGNSNVLMRAYEFSDELYAGDSLYETSVIAEKVMFVDELTGDGELEYKLTEGSNDLTWRPGSGSEIYKVTVETRIRGKKVPGTDIVTYLSWRGVQDEK